MYRVTKENMKIPLIRHSLIYLSGSTFGFTEFSDADTQPCLERKGEK